MVFTTLQEPTRNEVVAVSTTSKIISDAREADVMQNKRKVIVVRNNSAAATSIITINLGYSAAVANAGIVLRQYESFTDANDGAYECWQGVITAICADANGSLSIFER